MAKESSFSRSISYGAVINEYKFIIIHQLVVEIQPKLNEHYDLERI